MTVKDAVKVLRNVETISVGFGDRAIRFDPDDLLMLEVYGNYVIDGIYSDDGKEYELNVAMRAIKEGDNV